MLEVDNVLMQDRSTTKKKLVSSTRNLSCEMPNNQRILGNIGKVLNVSGECQVSLPEIKLWH